MPKIKVIFNDFTEDVYKTIEDAEGAILEASAEGVMVDWVEEYENEDNIYSCVWSVKLQKEK